MEIPDRMPRFSFSAKFKAEPSEMLCNWVYLLSSYQSKALEILSCTA